MPTWPSTLPIVPLADGFRETPPDTVVRTAMDAGPAKLRRRTTAGVRLLSAAYLLSAAQVATLDGFFSGAAQGGAAAFSYPHPRDGAAVSCRFRAPPAYTPDGAGFYRAALDLEILP